MKTVELRQDTVTKLTRCIGSLKEDFVARFQNGDKKELLIAVQRDLKTRSSRKPIPVEAAA